jgi:hypothetical protein
MKTSMLEVRQAWVVANNLPFKEPSNEQRIREALDTIAYWTSRASPTI